MINGLLSTIKDYKGINKGLDKVIDYIVENYNNLSSLPLGKTIIDDDITITKLEYFGKEKGISFPEEHRKHLDMQILLQGQEICYFDYLRPEFENCVQKPYNEESDVVKYDVELKNKLIFNNTNFTIFTPSDVHLPSQKIDDKKIVKLVIKVLIH